MADVNSSPPQHTLVEGIDLTYVIFTGPEFGEWGGSSRLAEWEAKGKGGGGGGGEN